MKILGIEASGKVASVAIVEDALLKAEFTINNKMTHSQTLLPMLEQMLSVLGEGLEEIDAIAVSAGPGSFTGLRIGAATAKGLGLALGRPLIKVSSLAALGLNISGGGDEVVVCPLMDARRGQVYCAAYQSGLTLIREQAMDVHDFIKELNGIDTCGAPSFIFLGDGAPVSEEAIAGELLWDYSFAGAENNRQRAASVAALGRLLYQRWLRENGRSAEEVKALSADAITCFDDTVMHADDFVPEYLRKPQAEREKEAGLLEDPGTHSLKKIARGSKEHTEKAE